MNTLVMAPKLDDRYGAGKVTSRIGIETEATVFEKDDDLFAVVEQQSRDEPLHCVLTRRHGDGTKVSRVLPAIGTFGPMFTRW